MRVYIAGPYTKGDVAVNVRNAMEVGITLLKLGHAPYVPHLTHFLHLHEPQPYERWMALDIEYLQLCESVVRLPGESSGADTECALAKQLRIPVYYGMNAFLRGGSE